MRDVILALVSALCGSGVMGLVTYLIKRHDDREAANGAEREALRYLMLYIIQERSKELIEAGNVTVDELRSINQWHDVYHVGLGGNGDADALMERVKNLPLKI